LVPQAVVLPQPCAMAPALAAAPEPALAHVPKPRRWSTHRIAAVEALWGEGFTGPGGARETLRLATPMGLNQSLTLLLLGGGLGGPATAIATKYGAWVESFEADEEQAAIAEQRRRGDPALRRVSVGGWSREAPSFKPQSAHHVLALEALRGAPLAPVLAGVARALRPHGHIVMTEMVCGTASPGADREFTARLSCRGPSSCRPN
jgi:hypothetical protein